MNQNVNLPHVHESVIHMLAAAAARAPNAIALQCSSETITYREFAACVAALARRLREELCENKRVGLIAANSAQMAIALLAAQAGRAQVVPINPAYTARELTELLEDAGVALILCDATEFERVESSTRHLTTRPTCINLGQDALKLINLKSALPNAFPVPLPDSTTLASLQYTGGTTGKPKGVQITHGQICINISQREAFLPTRPDQEVILCVMPLFHVFAIAMCLHLSIYCRGRLVILQKYHPADVLAAISAERVTILPAAPTVFIGLMGHSQFRQTAFDSLRVCYSGSAPLPAEVLRLWEDATSTRILEGYGQTEAGPVLSYASERDGPRPGSVGRPLPLTEINIVSLDDGKTVLPLGDCGEIRARGPQIMSGYRNRPEETAAALRDGWLFTGDLGFLDAGGYLHISGRKKEIAIVGGFNVYPREIEEVLCSHPDIEQAAALGVPDAYRGEVIAAWVVLRTGSSVTRAALQAYCAERLASYKRPQIITLATELPRTTVGKIDKSQLLDSLALQNGLRN